MTDLVNATGVAPILNDAMGRFDPPIVPHPQQEPPAHMWHEWEGMGSVVAEAQSQ